MSVCFRDLKKSVRNPCKTSPVSVSQNGCVPGKGSGGKDEGKGNLIPPGHRHIYSALLGSRADPTRACWFIIWDPRSLVGEGDQSVLSPEPSTQEPEKSSLAPRCPAGELFCLNLFCGPRLAYDWAPAQLPFGTPVPYWPWKPAPNHSCLAGPDTAHS